VHNPTFKNRCHTTSRQRSARRKKNQHRNHPPVTSHSRFRCQTNPQTAPHPAIDPARVAEIQPERQKRIRIRPSGGSKSQEQFERQPLEIPFKLRTSPFKLLRGFLNREFEHRLRSVQRQPNPTPTAHYAMSNSYWLDVSWTKDFDTGHHSRWSRLSRYRSQSCGFRRRS